MNPINQEKQKRIKDTIDAVKSLEESDRFMVAISYLDKNKKNLLRHVTFTFDFLNADVEDSLAKHKENIFKV